MQAFHRTMMLTALTTSNRKYRCHLQPAGWGLHWHCRRDQDCSEGPHDGAKKLGAYKIVFEEDKLQLKVNEIHMGVPTKCEMQQTCDGKQVLANFGR